MNVRASVVQRLEQWWGAIALLGGAIAAGLVVVMRRGAVMRRGGVMGRGGDRGRTAPEPTDEEADWTVFVSYRREEARHLAGRLGDRLRQGSPPMRVFLDVDAIAPGDDFERAISGEVDASDILLAVIGPTWAQARGPHGVRRLDDPHDYVVVEIATALRRGKDVIPVLIDGADMPRDDELPAALRPLAHRQAIRVDHDTFASDVSALRAALEKRIHHERIHHHIGSAHPTARADSAPD
ncbi:MAG: toll/interleukin-1 receptor domain-containing protein [Pseudonocardia sp.]